MDPEFWRARWRKGEIGFHQPHATPALVRHADRLSADPRDRILLPLCGKTLDLIFLSGRGHPVIGVEVVEEALEAFFKENALSVERGQAGPHRKLFAHGVTGVVADFLGIEAGDIGGPVQGIFDRGALVAVPPETRGRYAERELGLLAPGGRILLVAFEYDAAKHSGPPFSVGEEVIREHYAAAASIERLERRDIIEEEPRFKQRGLDWLEESVWLITQRA